MANVAVALQKSLLDWSLNNLTATRPTAWFAGLATAAPASNASSEIGTGSGYTRQTSLFGSASTVAGSGTATNTASLSFGPFSTAQSISGIFIHDTVSSGAGTMLYYGLLSAARTVSSGDSLIVASGALTVTMA